MGFYGNLKIRNKLILGFATVVSMALTIGIIGYFQIQNLNGAANYLFERGVKPTEYIGDIAVNFERMRINLRDYIQASDLIQKNYYEDKITKFHSRIENAEKKLEPTLSDQEAKKLFAELNKAHLEYHPHFNRIMELSKLGKATEAMRYLKSDDVEIAEGNEIDAIENMQIYLLANSKKNYDLNTATTSTTGRIVIGLAIAVSLLAAIMAFIITRSIESPLRRVLDALLKHQESAKEKSRLVEAIANGNLNQEVTIAQPLDIPVDKLSKDETGLLLSAVVGMSTVQSALDQSFARMTATLRQNREQETLYREQETIRDWFRSGQNQLNTILRGDKSIGELTQRTLTFLTEYIGAKVGVFYLYEEAESTIRIASSYAIPLSKLKSERIQPAEEGLAGQAVLMRKRICLKSAPPGYLSINSGIGEAEPVNIVVQPLMYNSRLFGVLEIGSFNIFSDNDLEFLNQSTEGIAIALSVNMSRQDLHGLVRANSGSG